MSKSHISQLIWIKMYTIADVDLNTTCIIKSPVILENAYNILLEITDQQQIW